MPECVSLAHARSTSNATMFFSPRLNSTSIKWIGSPPPRDLSMRYSSRYRHSEVVLAFSGGFAILAGVPAGALDAC